MSVPHYRIASQRAGSGGGARTPRSPLRRRRRRLRAEAPPCTSPGRHRDDRATERKDGAQDGMTARARFQAATSLRVEADSTFESSKRPRSPARLPPPKNAFALPAKQPRAAAAAVSSPARPGRQAAASAAPAKQPRAAAAAASSPARSGRQIATAAAPARQPFAAAAAAANTTTTPNPTATSTAAPTAATGAAATPPTAAAAVEPAESAEPANIFSYRARRNSPPRNSPSRAPSSSLTPSPSLAPLSAARLRIELPDDKLLARTLPAGWAERFGELGGARKPGETRGAVAAGLAGARGERYYVHLSSGR
ncbi:hypothetical protein T492DRAFT_895832 [Pavlovales sp. CCMP2436]|nr:hypothetical protein T492DRAFT_895832 [Pavlovales sp. CCMP2436]